VSVNTNTNKAKRHAGKNAYTTDGRSIMERAHTRKYRIYRTIVRTRSVIVIVRNGMKMARIG
jgi:hypothetical protein